jgi:hypothetical protein
MMMFQQLWTVMTSSSAPLRKWRSTSPSTVESFVHTHVYDVNLLERVGLDEELPTILWTIGWGTSTMSLV